VRYQYPDRHFAGLDEEKLAGCLALPPQVIAGRQLADTRTIHKDLGVLRIETPTERVPRQKLFD
jgi:hypothetical protein